MKEIKKYSKAFLPCAILSLVVIVFGIVGFFVKGINLGIDFEPGLIEEVKIAPSAIELTYNGSAAVSIETNNTELSVVVSGTGAENQTKKFTYGKYPTVKDMVDGLNTVEGVTAVLKNNADSDTYGIFTNSAVSAKLSSDVPYFLYVPAEESASIDEVRDSLSGLNVVVKELGSDENRSFQIRTPISDDSKSNYELTSEINKNLQEKFGEDEVAIIKTDFVGSGLSSSLARKSVVLALVTILLIWLYATIRFHWDFALGSVIALIHDCLIIFTFIFWTGIEFSTTTLAAVLTIFGYSINATVVILDRVRNNIKLVETKKFNDILDASISQTLTRSIITTVTTLFAAISLWVFTTGSIRDFAIVLTIGLISGCYSSMFISSGFISLMRRHWEPGENAFRVRPKKSTARNN